MCHIEWRPAADLPPDRAQNGTAVLSLGGRLIVLALEIRPGRTTRRHRRSPLTLAIEGDVHLFQDSVRQCKSKAEKILRNMERRAGHI